MSNLGKSSVQDAQVLQEATDWLLASQEGALDPIAEKKFSEWLAASEQHMRAFNKLSETWDMMTLLEMSSETVYQPEQAKWYKALALKLSALKEAAWPALVPARMFASLAATVLLVTVLFPSNEEKLEPTGQDYSLRLKTRVGEQSTTVIADGSSLNLNTDTELTTHFTKALRRVKLVKGEVEFNVIANAERPFVINVGSYTVTVLGTVFVIKKNGADIQVLVTAGTVTVQKASGAEDGAIVLSAGETGSAYDNQPFDAMGKFNPERTLAWTKGLLIFDETPLADVAREMNRYDDRHILVRGPGVELIRISGVFRIDHIASALDAIIANNGLRVDYSDEKRLILHAD